MKTRALILFASSIVLAGCPSGGGSGPDAQTSTSSGAAASGGVAAPSASAAPAPGGPLAGLESSPSVNEAWTTDDGQQAPMLYFARENVRVSASCRAGNGPLACDAIRQLRGGQPVTIARRSLDGRTSAGVKVCQHLSHPIVHAHNSVGSEDSFCRFPDGSLVSNGALEQYAMHVTD